jgi:hypothetical protein
MHAVRKNTDLLHGEGTDVMCVIFPVSTPYATQCRPRHDTDAMTAHDISIVESSVESTRHRLQTQRCESSNSMPVKAAFRNGQMPYTVQLRGSVGTSTNTVPAAATQPATQQGVALWRHADV